MNTPVITHIPIKYSESSGCFLKRRKQLHCYIYNLYISEGSVSHINGVWPRKYS